jgi:hypothetical protein
MKVLHPQHPPPSLHPELNALIDQGLLAERAPAELTVLAGAIRKAVARGDMTCEQARALGRMLGVRTADGNRRRARRAA